MLKDKVEKTPAHEFEEQSRRGFLTLVIGAGGALWAAVAAFPLFKYFVAPEMEELISEVELGDPSQFAPGSVTRVALGTKPVFVIAKEAGELLAVSAICTHLGCTIRHDEVEDGFHCPCHGGRYDYEGTNIAGPPPKPLERFFTVDREGSLWLTRTDPALADESVGEEDDMTELPARVWTWLTDRYPIQAVIDFVPRKQVPMHSRSVWYMWGSIPLVLFMMQVATGILLMTYYQPGMTSSHASVHRIVHEVQFGWLLRSVHSWSANLMVLFIFVHMYAKIFTTSYRKPRELTWLTGFGMLGLAYAFGFFGYLLPWDQLAYFATVIGLNSAHAIPVIGTDLVHYMQGGESFNDITLSRFYTVHVMMLPMALGGLLAAHLTFLQVQGETVPEHYAKLPDSEKESVSFFPDFVMREAALQVSVIALLVFLAVIFPWHLGAEADPLVSAPVGIKPEWYFLAPFQILRLMPAHLGPIGGELLGLIVLNIIVAILATLPFWDREGKYGARFGAVFLTGQLILTYFGWAID